MMKKINGTRASKNEFVFGSSHSTVIVYILYLQIQPHGELNPHMNVMNLAIDVDVIKFDVR